MSNKRKPKEASDIKEAAKRRLEKIHEKVEVEKIARKEEGTSCGKSCGADRMVRLCGGVHSKAQVRGMAGHHSLCPDG